MKSLELVIHNCFKRSNNQCEFEERDGLWTTKRCPEKHLEPGIDIKGKTVLRPYYLVGRNVGEDDVKMLCQRHHNIMMESKIRLRKLSKKKADPSQINLMDEV